MRGGARTGQGQSRWPSLLWAQERVPRRAQELRPGGTGGQLTVLRDEGHRGGYLETPTNTHLLSEMQSPVCAHTHTHTLVFPQPPRCPAGSEWTEPPPHAGLVLGGSAPYRFYFFFHERITASQG